MFWERPGVCGGGDDDSQLPPSARSAPTLRPDAVVENGMPDRVVSVEGFFSGAQMQSQNAARRATGSGSDQKTDKLASTLTHILVLLAPMPAVGRSHAIADALRYFSGLPTGNWISRSSMMKAISRDIAAAWSDFFQLQPCLTQGQPQPTNTQTQCLRLLQLHVLITPGPPYGILDQIAPGSEHLGCEVLCGAVEEKRPRLHIFGHIHGSAGSVEKGITRFVNAAYLNEQYRPLPPAGKIRVIDL
jgi:hypothetical protein